MDEEKSDSMSNSVESEFENHQHQDEILEIIDPPSSTSDTLLLLNEDHKSLLKDVTNSEYFLKTPFKEGFKENIDPELGNSKLSKSNVNVLSENDKTNYILGLL